ncbi:MAG: hypothetical protein QOG30_479 [Acidimicrobiaceae bacterium]
MIISPCPECGTEYTVAFDLQLIERSIRCDSLSKPRNVGNCRSRSLAPMAENVKARGHAA